MSRSISLNRSKYQTELDQSKIFSNLIDGFSSNVHYTKDKYLFYDESQEQSPSHQYKKEPFKFITSNNTNKGDNKSTNQKLLQDQKKIDILKLLDPEDLMSLQKLFNDQNNGQLTLTQFVMSVLTILKENGQLQQQNIEELVGGLVDKYRIIDINQDELISFYDLTSYIFDEEMQVNKKETLNIQLEFVQHYTINKFSNSIEKIMLLEKMDKLLIMDQNYKQINIHTLDTFEKIKSIDIYTVTLSAVQIIEAHEHIVATTSDKFINFYEIISGKLVRRFQLPEMQNKLAYDPEKKILFSSGLNTILYAWSLDDIMSIWFLDDIKAKVETYKKVLVPIYPFDIGHTPSCILYIISQKILVTGSSDSIIRLYEYKYSEIPSVRFLRGHQKGIRDMCYSETYKYIISVSFDYTIIIWNPFLEKPVSKLRGHKASLVNVVCCDDVNTAITMDIEGTLKVWDLGNLALLQTINIDEVKRAQCLVYVKNKKQILLGARRLYQFQFNQSFNNNLTDDLPIQHATYNKITNEIYICTGRSLKVWDLKTGILIRQFHKVTSKDITSLQLHPNHRMIFLGDAKGDIRLIDLKTGNLVKSNLSHFNEISSIKFSHTEKALITCSWDQSIKVYDEGEEAMNFGSRKGLIKSIECAHSTEINVMDYSENTGLIITGACDGSLRIWDLYKNRIEADIQFFRSEISVIRVLHPYPAVLVGDISGVCGIFGLRPNKHKYRVLAQWKNMFTLQKAVGISCVDFIYDEEYLDQAQIYIADEKGIVRILEIQQLIEECQLERAILDEIAPKRFFYRVDDIDYSKEPIKSNFIYTYTNNSILNEKCVVQVKQWQASSETINFLQVILNDQKLYIFTVGLDRKALLWNSKAECIGNFMQGKKVNLEWNFQFKSHTNDKSTKTEVIRQLILNAHKFANEKKPHRLLTALPYYNHQQQPAVNMKSIIKDLTDIESILQIGNKQKSYKHPRSFSINSKRLKTLK